MPKNTYPDRTSTARNRTTTGVSTSTSEQRREDAQAWSPLARYASEFFGTFLLVFGGVGTALFAANVPSATDNQQGVGYLGVALAFGLTLVAGISAVGHISGGHFNPAVTLGLLAAGRTDAKHVPGYIVSQVVGGSSRRACSPPCSAARPVPWPRHRTRGSPRTASVRRARAGSVSARCS